MKFNFFNKKKSPINIKEEWNKLGSEYAKGVNEMVEFGEKNGWENWKGKEPEDKREHLADEIFNLLKKANENNTVEQFRNDYPPSHSPIIKFLEKKGQSIEQLQFIDGLRIPIRNFYYHFTQYTDQRNKPVSRVLGGEFGFSYEPTNENLSLRACLNKKSMTNFR